MANLFHMKSPLMIRLPSSETRVLAEYFPHPHGLLFFDLYWHLGQPEQAIHLVEGKIKGEGPWKVGDCIIHVLGCHGVDFGLAAAFEAWQQYLAMNGADYPAPEQIQAVARRYGATIPGN